MIGFRPALLATVSALALSLALVAGPAQAHDDMAAPNAAPLPAGVSDIVRDPTDLPPEIGKRGPTHAIAQCEDLGAGQARGRAP